jgi:hypothetical protein
VAVAIDSQHMSQELGDEVWCGFLWLS